MNGASDADIGADLRRSLARTEDALGDNFTTLSQRESLIASKLGEIRRLIAEYGAREAELARYADKIKRLKASVGRARQAHESDLLASEGAIRDEAADLEAALGRLGEAERRIAARSAELALEREAAALRADRLLKAENRCRVETIEMNERIAETRNREIEMPANDDLRYWSERIDSIEVKAQKIEGVIENLNERQRSLEEESQTVRRLVSSIKAKRQTLQRSFDSANETIRARLETAITECNVHNAIYHGNAALYAEITENIRSQRLLRGTKGDAASQIDVKSCALRDALREQEQRITAIKSETTEIEAQNAVLRRSSTRKEANLRFEIIRVKSSRIEALDLTGRSHQELSFARESRKALARELKAIERGAEKACRASTLIARSAERIMDPPIAKQSVEIERLIRLLEEINGQIAIANEQSALMERHAFDHLPAWPRSEPSERVRRLRKKLQSVRRATRTLRKEISVVQARSSRIPPPIICPSVWPLSCPAKAANTSDRLNLRLSSLQSQINSLRIALSSRRIAIQERKSRLARVNEVYFISPTPCETVHCCDRCMHRYENYELLPENWSNFLGKLQREISLWSYSKSPSAQLLALWNNQLEHFMRSVAVSG